jgi:type II secretory pathway component PulF
MPTLLDDQTYTSQKQSSRWSELDETDLNDFREESDEAGQGSGFKFPVFSTRSIPTTGLLLSINQLTVMTQNGIDLAESLETAATHARSPELSTKLHRIHELVNAGSSFSAALAANAKGLPASMPALIAAAESTGQVPAALDRLSKLMRAELQLHSTIVGALIYPVVLIIVSLGVVLAMLFGVLPQFGNVFENLGRPIPPATEVLLDTGRWARQNIWLCFAVLGCIPIAAIAGFAHPRAKRLWHGCLLWAPLISHAYRPLATGRMFRLLGSMLGGGVPLLEAVRLTRLSLRNSYFVELLNQVEEDVLAGDMAHRALQSATFLPIEAAQMVATAERTGRLADVLNDCGQFYEEQGERVLRKLVHSLEPVIILGMGVLVAGVVLSIMLPLLDISSVA